MKYSILTKPFLQKEYLNNYQSTGIIAKKYGIPEITIWRYLLKYGISLRKVGNKTLKFNQKEKNANYKHGKYCRKYYCKRCGKSIHILTGIYGLGYCKSCGSGGRGKKKPGTSKAQTGKNNNNFGKPASNGKRIRYQNICFRSTWEVKYAKYLDKHQVSWQYESKTFDLGDTTYTPDFYLPEIDKYIEIKGYWWSKQREKFEKFKNHYPKENIKILFKNELQVLGVI